MLFHRNLLMLLACLLGHAGSVLAAQVGPLAAAVLRDDLVALQQVLARGGNPDLSDPELQRVPLQIAVSPGSARNPAVVGALVAAGAPLNAIDAKTGLTPLMAATLLPPETDEPANIAAQKSADLIAHLLRLGANPNQRGRDGESPLIRAVSSGNLPAVQTLLRNGAQVDQADASGKTALIQSIIMRRVDILSALIEGGANLRAADAGGDSALMFAAGAGDIESARAILAHADIRPRTVIRTPPPEELLAYVNLRNAKQSTALHLAYAAGAWRELLDVLLDAGADPTVKDANGMRPQELATAAEKIRAATLGKQKQESEAAEGRSNLTRWIIGGVAAAAIIVGAAAYAQHARDKKKQAANATRPPQSPAAPTPPASAPAATPSVNPPVASPAPAPTPVPPPAPVMTPPTPQPPVVTPPQPVPPPKPVEPPPAALPVAPAPPDSHQLAMERVRALQIVSQAFQPLQPEAGKPYVLAVTLRNAGTSSLNGIRLRLRDSRLANDIADTWADLGPGEQKSVPLAVSAGSPQGRFSPHLLVNPTLKVKEINPNSVNMYWTLKELDLDVVAKPVAAPAPVVTPSPPQPPAVAPPQPAPPTVTPPQSVLPVKPVEPPPTGPVTPPAAVTPTPSPVPAPPAVPTPPKETPRILKVVLTDLTPPAATPIAQQTTNLRVGVHNTSQHSLNLATLTATIDPVPPATQPVVVGRTRLSISSGDRKTVDLPLLVKEAGKYTITVTSEPGAVIRPMPAIAHPPGTKSPSDILDGTPEKDSRKLALEVKPAPASVVVGPTPAERAKALQFFDVTQDPKPALPGKPVAVTVTLKNTAQFALENVSVVLHDPITKMDVLTGQASIKAGDQVKVALGSFQASPAQIYSVRINANPVDKDAALYWMPRDFALDVAAPERPVDPGAPSIRLTEMESNGQPAINGIRLLRARTEPEKPVIGESYKLIITAQNLGQAIPRADLIVSDVETLGGLYSAVGNFALPANRQIELTVPLKESSRLNRDVALILRPTSNKKWAELPLTLHFALPAEAAKEPGKPGNFPANLKMIPGSMKEFWAAPYPESAPAIKALNQANPGSLFLIDVRASFTWFCKSGPMTHAIQLKPHDQLGSDGTYMFGLLNKEAAYGCPEAVFPPSRIIYIVKYRNSPTGNTYVAEHTLPGSLPLPGGVGELDAAHSIDAGGFPLGYFSVRCSGDSSARDGYSAPGGPCNSAFQSKTRSSVCFMEYKNYQSADVAVKLNQCLANNSTGSYRNNYLAALAESEKLLAQARQKPDKDCPTGYKREGGIIGPCVYAGSPGKPGIYELGGRQVNPDSANPGYETYCLPIASRDHYKLAFTVAGAVYYQQSLHNTLNECQNRGRAWVASKGKLEGSYGGPGPGAGSSGSGGISTGTTTLDKNRLMAQCDLNNYRGPDDDPQFDSFCKNAYINTCLDKATGTQTYAEDTKKVCGLLDNFLKAAGGGSTGSYCGYCR